MESSALLSPDRKYRYWLERSWSEKPRALWRILVVIGLNPSTADETLDDPTIRRCIGYARRWEHDALLMVNLFAYRTSKPAVLIAEGGRGADVVGPDNDEWLREATAEAATILCAWGADGWYQGRGPIVADRLGRLGRKLSCLGTTANGNPKHPLYLKGDLLPVAYSVAV